jgi:hypothetical protein
MCVPCSLVYLIKLSYRAEWEDDSDWWTGTDEEGGSNGVMSEHHSRICLRPPNNTLKKHSRFPENWTWNLQYMKHATHSTATFGVTTWCEGSATPKFISTDLRLVLKLAFIPFILSRVRWLQTGFGLIAGFIGHFYISWPHFTDHHHSQTTVFSRIAW